MVLEDKGTISRKVSGAGKYSQMVVNIPKSISVDSQFPFKLKNGKIDVLIKIDGNKLVIQKVEK